MQEYSRVTAQVRMIMFISMFVATLFFLAAGSMLYFRFFLEIQEDQARYIALRRIGLSWKEVRGIVTREMAIMFFTPWAVAFVHQMFALRSYSTVTSMMPVEVWKYKMAAGIFFAPQTVYFALARSAYLGAGPGCEVDNRKQLGRNSRREAHIGISKARTAFLERMWDIKH